jgi:putative membrane-bound dehydrogenase-like protein
MLVVVVGLLGWMIARIFYTNAIEKGRGPNELGAIRVPEGFTIERVVGPELASYVAFGTLDERGRLFLCESSGPNTMTTEEMLKNPSCRIRVLEDVDKDGVYDRGKVFADRIPFPAGVLSYRGGIYVAAPPDLLRFEDTDDDGVADRREVVLSGWTLSANGATLNGPFMGPDGWLYMPDARRGYRIETKEGTLLQGKGGRIWRCRPDGTGLEWISAGGFDNPVELVFTPAGETIGTMTYFTDPKAGQRDALMHWVEGGVYPKPHSVIQEDRLKLTGDLMPVMSKFPRVSPAGLLRYRGTMFGAEYRESLFSAQFNTHRVLRHIVSREGATFRTKDENFLTCSDPNFHPTDLIEDADGSLLVIDTGGWFIKGCPVSIVERPENRGAIYRIRKQGATRTRDPRGEDLKLQTLGPAELVPHLGDPRPAVQDKVLELLVQAGEASVDALAGALRNSPSAEVRCRAVFGLFRNGSARARQTLRSGLNDADLQVRVASARVLGMARDREAVPRLMEMVQNDQPAARRQAATALGQIGDKASTAALLAASANPGDRFVEHSIIHALIRFNDAGPVMRALDQQSPSVRKAALISLDQMDGAHLRREHLAPHLGSQDRELRHAALWVVSHHPDWSGEVLQFLRGRLNGPKLSDAEAEAVGEVLVSLCEDLDVQELVAQLLANAGITAERKLFVLDAIDRCKLAKLPKSWIQQIEAQLRASDVNLRSRAAALASSRGLIELENELRRLADNQTEPAALRTAALGALVASRPQLSDSQSEFLLGQLQSITDATERQSAALVLGRAKLNDRQLLVLAGRHIPQADPLIRASLLEAFQGNSNPEVGKALVAALLKSSQGLDSFNNAPMQALFASFPDSVRAAAAPLLQRLREVREGRISRLRRLESQLAGGVIDRGQKVFFGQKVACSNCHTIGVQGKEVGPDLTSVGAIRSRHDLLEAIIFPSASFVRDYEAYRVQTADDVYVGFIRNQNRDAVLLVTGPDSKIRIPRDKIVSMKPSTVSVMPEGLDEALTGPELADLISFLEAQK